MQQPETICMYNAGETKVIHLSIKAPKLKIQMELNIFYKTT